MPAKPIISQKKSKSNSPDNINMDNEPQNNKGDKLQFISCYWAELGEDEESANNKLPGVEDDKSVDN